MATISIYESKSSYFTQSVHDAVFDELKSIMHKSATEVERQIENLKIIRWEDEDEQYYD